MKKIGMVSLGCSKTLVDSEQMLYLLRQAGYEITSEVENVDCVLVNTCGFIDSAKQEAIDNILELAELKREGKIHAIVVTGCLVERYKEEIFSEMPEVDAIVGCGSFGDIVQAVDKALSGERITIMGDIDANLEERGRVATTPNYSVYIKIAEGCDNHCGYCVIPSLRGKFRSRSIENILNECKSYADKGAKELIIIAQDITRYGLDIYGQRRLIELLTEIVKIEGISWVRLHYLYPDGVDDALIDFIANEPKIVKYLDIPIQHINNKILTSMNRRGTGEEISTLFTKLRERIPQIVIRTSLIVGLPGEGDKEFDELVDFMKSTRIQRAGVFTFSPQEGTLAAKMDSQVDEDVKLKRQEILMGIQAEIMDEYNEKLIGTTIQVLCEGYDRIAEIWIGRSYADSPEIDGKVFFTAVKKPKAGQMVNVKITDVLDGDPLGKAE